MAFELIGSLPGPWEVEIDTLERACERHPWGGEGPERIIVVEPANGAVPETLERWMEPDEFRGFWEKYEKARYYFGAKTFTARDGLVTSLILPVPDREAFLHLLANQLVAGSLRRRSLAEGTPIPTDPAAVNGSAIWNHYVCERARFEIGRSAGIDFGSFDQTDLAPEATDVQDALDRLAAEVSPGAPLSEESVYVWLRAVRLWASALGPADAGSPHYALEIQAFATQPFAVATQDSWQLASDALRDIWSHPAELLAEVNERAGADVWKPLEHALFVLWREITTDD